MPISYAYLWNEYRKVKRFLADAQRAHHVQHEVLLQKLRRNTPSDFGRDHGFSEIRSVADFRRRVPVTDYEYYRPYVERVKRGDLGAMFGPGTRLLMFALTSGTTSDSKHVPITGEFFEEYQRGWRLWGLQTYRDHLDLLRRKTVKLGSDWQQFHTEAGTPCGNISGLVAETTPRIYRRRFATPRELIKIPDPRSKHYAALRLSFASRHVGLIGTANPSTLVELARLADARRESLLRDIFDGTLSDQTEVPQHVRQLLKRWTSRRDPARARELEKIIQRTGRLYPRDVWPHLSLLAVWLGGSVGVYLPLLKQYYGDVAFRDHGLSASEGRMTIPLADGTRSGILEFINHYFEFVPELERGHSDPTVLEAHELEVGKNYYILLTTSGGLYRYDIRDVVRCTGFEGTAPLLEFLNKGTHFSNITGEKLSEFQVVDAVRSSFAELGLRLEHFTVAPVMRDRLGYVLLIEPGTYGEKEQELARRINGHLVRLNCEYAQKLESGRLDPLAVREVPPGTWSAFRQRRIADRGNLEEYKHPCLVNDLEFVDQLLRFDTSRRPTSEER